MTDWRTILSWKQVPREIKVGDLVKVLKVEGTLLRPSWIGVEGVVGEIDPNRNNWENRTHVGMIRVRVDAVDVIRDIYFPFNFWRDYLEIVS